MESSKALSQAKQVLDSKGVSNAGLDSLILLAHALSLSKEEVIFNPQRQLSEAEEKRFFDLVARRAAREPTSHLLGKREFYGENFLVSKDVLDPRPDSEILVEAVLASFEKGGGAKAPEDFGATTSQQKSPSATNVAPPPFSKGALKILELGVGSGCLIITLLKAFKNAVGTAVDISEAAIKIAEKNSENHQTNQRLKILKSDLFAKLSSAEKFNLIISNPPYIPTKEIETLEPEVKIYEPRSALDGGEDGLDFYRRIAAEAKNFLTESGKIFLEIGFGQKEKVTEIFTQQKFYFTGSTLDLSGVERILEFSLNK